MLRIEMLLVVVCASMLLPPRALGRAAQEAPALGADASTAGAQTLGTDDWAGVRAANQVSRHSVVAVEGGYQARNPGQGWRVCFDGRGVRVLPDAGGFEWGLQLERYGRAGGERAISTPLRSSAEGQRVAYEWDASLEEWYVNDERGLEHGFIVRDRPAQGSEQGPLTFRLAVRGALWPEVAAGGRDVRFVSGSGATVVTYSGLSVLDAEGKELDAGFERSASGLLLSIDDRVARYPLTIDPIAQQVYLKASNTEAEDGFGASAALSGDTLVVGAPFEDSPATGVGGAQGNGESSAGAAYVFVRAGDGSWTQQAYLKASNTDQDDIFGASVAISGDTIVVGATLADEDEGTAYVFVRSGTTWSQEGLLEASNAQGHVFAGPPGDRFGESVAVGGDIVVVGAPGEDSAATGVNGDETSNGAFQAGAAYVFVRSGGTWTQEAYLKASNTGGGSSATAQDGDAFGSAVAAFGDTVVVGAHGEDSSATGVNGDENDNSAIDSGAAYVFVRSGTSWSQEAYVKAANTGGQAGFSPGDAFGSAVAFSDQTLVVGAPKEGSHAKFVNGDPTSNRSPHAGAAYVFVRNGTSWSQEAYLKASNSSGGVIFGDAFGGAVTISGDVVVVGAVGEDSHATGVNGDQFSDAASDSGAAYVFVRNGTSWTQNGYIKASNTGTGDAFGHAVAVSGDVLVITALQEDSSAAGINGDQSNNGTTDSGAGYAFVLDPQSDVTFRNAGTNPASYVAGQVVIGTLFTATVDNNLAFQTTSALFAFNTPLTLTLGGGQTLLCFDWQGVGELFTGGGLFPSSSTGGIDTHTIAFPNDPALIGMSYASQAIQYGNPPFVLSNAQDLTIGSF